MSVQIRTERGNVRVVDSDCKYRSCLHVHWSRNAEATKIDKRTGAEVKTFPLVCIRNEQYGCPNPLPVPVKPPQQKTPRGRCDKCGYSFTIRKDETIARHRLYTGYGADEWVICDGSCKPPREAALSVSSSSVPAEEQS